MRRWSGPTCCRPGPGGTRARAAVVAIGVGSLVAHVWAHMGEEAGSARGRSRRSLHLLGATAPGRRRSRGSRSRCRDAPVGAPPEGNAKEVTRRRRARVTTAASRDDSVVDGGGVGWGSRVGKNKGHKSRRRARQLGPARTLHARRAGPSSRGACRRLHSARDRPEPEGARAGARALHCPRGRDRCSASRNTYWW